MKHSSKSVSKGEVSASDKIQKLEQLKHMLDKGLITREDYDKRKKKLLGT
jgi:hypothetical protein